MLKMIYELDFILAFPQRIDAGAGTFGGLAKVYIFGSGELDVRVKIL